MSLETHRHCMTMCYYDVVQSKGLASCVPPPLISLN